MGNEGDDGDKRNRNEGRGHCFLEERGLCRGTGEREVCNVTDVRYRTEDLVIVTPSFSQIRCRVEPQLRPCRTASLSVGWSSRIQICAREMEENKQERLSR